ncbi:DUF1573 domain-containing protein [Pedobacter insulae]|uniref:DUF1573 domain-containing protein n=1 Tax=Pedobacter insulae TaxID=414048 RepID=A0A1I2UBK8_9SPHI|nr:DUF1573 domain-containing protein [Pedobacter insulae]SFG74585.1 Protein of unknown function [Pedobacter insulae]
MKRLILSLLVSVLLAACGQNKDSSTAVVLDSTGKAVSAVDAPVIKFEEELYDFGVINEGESVKYEFKFKNVGKTPLIISNATATCGCTVPEYPTTPIKPGDEGKIKVIFNSQGKVGIQDKVVSIISNANPYLATLHVVGEVKAKK